MKKRLVSVIALAMAMLLALAIPATAENVEEKYFEHWNPDAPALKALIEYVEDRKSVV